MIHYLVRYTSGPGRPCYKALCGHTSENGREFTKVDHPSSEKVTCEACLKGLAYMAKL